jgi:hypothetical protein
MTMLIKKLFVTIFGIITRSITRFSIITLTIMTFRIKINKMIYSA